MRLEEEDAEIKEKEQEGEVVAVEGSGGGRVPHRAGVPLPGRDVALVLFFLSS